MPHAQFWWISECEIQLCPLFSPSSSQWTQKHLDNLEHMVTSAESVPKRDQLWWFMSVPKKLLFPPQQIVSDFHLFTLGMKQGGWKQISLGLPLWDFSPKNCSLTWQWLDWASKQSAHSTSVRTKMMVATTVKMRIVPSLRTMSAKQKNLPPTAPLQKVSMQKTKKESDQSMDNFCSRCLCASLPSWLATLSSS